MHIIVYFPNSDPIYNQHELPSGGSFHAYIWAMQAKDKYGPYFLGCYVYDEPGGEVLDNANGALSIRSSDPIAQTPWIIATDYKSDATNFVTNANSQMYAYLYCAHKTGTSIFTADYGLYWFDYQAGYDTVFTEFGWGNNREMDIALCRGAATAQGKNWGAIICWETKTNSTGALENGAALYSDLTLAYDNGAEYAVIFDYAGNNQPNPYPYGILTDDHFAAMEKFWNYIQQNPQKHGSVKADTALVLPEAYGFGFRSADDKIWGMIKRTTGQ